MNIFNKNGVNISIEDNRLFEMIRSMPKQKQVQLMFNILEYDDGDILKALAKRKHKDCIENNKRFIKISNEFDENICNAYLNVANKYKTEGEIWKQFIENETKH